MLRNGLCFVILIVSGCAPLRDAATRTRRVLSEVTTPQAQFDSTLDPPVCPPAPIERRIAVASAESATSPAESQSAEWSTSGTGPSVRPAVLQTDKSTDVVSAIAETADEKPVVPPIPEPPAELTLDDVIDSVYRSYPLLQAAIRSRDIAFGDHVAASGAFDLKLKGASENGSTGFYQTYRQSIGLVQPLFQGGEAFAGYRVGRGDFQPWYLERQTNNGGEFKAGVLVPLAQNRDIDERRARLWQTAWGRELVEPEIQAQLIGFVQDASFAYWEWVAAGADYRIAVRILKLAEERNDRIAAQVEAGFVDPPELLDNERLIAERRAKLADTDRKLRQTAAKLSLFLRNAAGQPLVPTADQLPTFPEAAEIEADDMAADISVALARRPEISVLNYLRRQLDVEYAQACNTLQPQLDAVVLGAQDMGLPTSRKRDKSEFELEASVFLDVPIQRRKARGKLMAISGKIAQLSAKRRLVEDKVAVDVQTARAALTAALIQIEQAAEAVRLAEDLAARERQNFEAGLSDLLKVTLREQYAVESAQKLVDARLLYFQAAADYRAALAQDSLSDPLTDDMPSP